MSGRNAGEPFGDAELDRLLGMVPPPPALPSGLTDRIVARATATPQHPPLPPRRARRVGRRRVGRRAWAGAVLGSFLLTIAATAAVLGGRVDFHRLASLPALLLSRHAAPPPRLAAPVRSPSSASTAPAQPFVAGVDRPPAALPPPAAVEAPLPASDRGGRGVETARLPPAVGHAEVGRRPPLLARGGVKPIEVTRHERHRAAALPRPVPRTPGLAERLRPPAAGRRGTGRCRGEPRVAAQRRAVDRASAERRRDAGRRRRGASGGGRRRGRRSTLARSAATRLGRARPGAVRRLATSHRRRRGAGQHPCGRRHRHAGARA